VPIIVCASAVGLIAWCATSKRRAASAVSGEAPACFRTLGLITYPLYLTHNVTGTAIIRVLVDAGLDASLALWASLGVIVVASWFICAKLEPAIRRLLKDAVSNLRRLPKAAPPSILPGLPPALRPLRGPEAAISV
jgi:peptidoglycan/LPS O-acetylase OafA/YrhL